MKKGLSLMLAIIFVISTLMLNVGAAGNIGEEETTELFNETVVTRHADGTITTATYNNYQVLSVLEGQNLDTSSYIPNLSTDAVVLPPITDLEPPESDFHTMNTAENRVGHLAVRRDVDDDGYAEKTQYITASLQRNDILISCAHYIWNPEYADSDSGGWPDSITFYAGVNGGSSVAYASFTEVSVSQSFIDNTLAAYMDGEETPNDFENDWSIIRINSNLGGLLGWFGLELCDSNSVGSTYHTIGYPYDEDDDMYESFGQQWKSIGSITRIEGKIAYYNNYSDDGNSGAPLLSNGDVYAIHTFSLKTNGVWVGSGGTRINDFLLFLILQERNASAERWESDI